MPAITTIKNRGGTAAAWTSANPVLALREIGLETDTHNIKIGDGVTAWTSLAYVGSGTYVGRAGTETITGAKTFDVATAAAPVKITGPNPQTSVDLLQVIGSERVPDTPSSGRYRVTIDQNMTLQTNAAICISTGLWTGPNQSIPPAVAQGRPVCLGIVNDIVGPMIFAQNNPTGSYFELQDYQEHKVVNTIVPPGAGGLGAWMGIGDNPIGTLTISDLYDCAASGGSIFTQFIMRHGVTGAFSSARLAQPSSGDLDISSNFKSGENAWPEWGIRMSPFSGMSFFTAPTPGGTRTELFAIGSSGPVLASAAATSGATLKNSPDMVYRSSYWNGSAAETKGWKIHDTQMGSGLHSLQFLIDETSAVVLAVGAVGMVGIGDIFVTNLANGMLHVVSTATTTPGVVVDSMASQTASIQKWRVGGTEAFAIEVDGIPKWTAAGNQQTTVGAAGAASALPATPTKYFKVKDSAGTTLVVPAYAAA